MELFYEQITKGDSLYENEIRRHHPKGNGISTENGGAKLLSNGRNKQYINCRMINGNKMLPLSHA